MSSTLSFHFKMFSLLRTLFQFVESAENYFFSISDFPPLFKRCLFNLLGTLSTNSTCQFCSFKLLNLFRNTVLGTVFNVGTKCTIRYFSFSFKISNLCVTMYKISNFSFHLLICYVKSVGNYVQSLIISCFYF
jgi:hypothetical protein